MAMEQAKLWGDEPPLPGENSYLLLLWGGARPPREGGEAPKGEYSYLYYSRGARPPRENIRIFIIRGGRGPQGRTLVSLLFAGGEPPSREKIRIFCFVVFEFRFL